MKLAILAALLFSASVPAKASEVTWEFVNTNITGYFGSGTFSGTFDYDADTGLSSNVDVDNSLGGGYSQVQQTSPSAYVVDGGFGVPFDMNFLVEDALTDAGGTFSFTGNFDSLESWTGTLVGTPDVAPTPEPSGLALLATGFVGVAGMVRRRFR
jgi:hypothetical protein